MIPRGFSNGGGTYRVEAEVEQIVSFVLFCWLLAEWANNKEVVLVLAVVVDLVERQTGLNPLLCSTERG